MYSYVGLCRVCRVYGNSLVGKKKKKKNNYYYYGKNKL